MILTYKIKHGQDYSTELAKAKQIAKFALQNKFNLSSASVKHFGLKSTIACQILRKYGRNKKAKSIRSVKLTVPGQGVKFDKQKRELYISCLKLHLTYYFDNSFTKINQVELDNTYAYISCQYAEPPERQVNHYIGVDLNTTGHCAVAGNPTTGKVYKLGKQAPHIHQKYKSMRKTLQKQAKYRKVKQIKNRESRRVKDLNHKISRHIVDLAQQSNAGIKLENLTNIRKTTKSRRSFRYALNSWSFYQLRKFIEYKARKLGIPIVLIDPAYTSQRCSRCGALGNRTGKQFKCPFCGHVENADVNASFNIALTSPGISQFVIDRDMAKGNTDIPKEATSRTMTTLEPTA